MKEETQAAGVRRRRSRTEVEQLVAEFETSGLNRTEFCRTHGLSLSTLSRYRNRVPQQDERPGGARWVAVEVAGPGHRQRTMGGSGLALVSGSGWRIEVGRSFDAGTLAQLLRVLERG